MAEAAVVAANRAYGYLPRYVAYIDYKAGTSYFLHCFQDLMVLAAAVVVAAAAAVQAEVVVGVADVKLGSWLKMASNYPCLLSRTVAEK